MWSMMPILPAICFIALAVARTASPPSVASREALLAMPSVTLAFSVFWAMDEVICSMAALVCSTLAACVPAPWLRLCAVALTCSDALDKESPADRTSVIDPPQLLHHRLH